MVENKEGHNSETLDILLEHILIQRTEALEHLQRGKSTMYTLINISTVLLGVLITTVIFIIQDLPQTETIYYHPFVFSATCLIVAILAGLFGSFTQYLKSALNPIGLHRSKNDTPDIVKENLLTEYISHQKGLIAAGFRYPLINDVMLTFTLSGVAQYVIGTFQIINPSSREDALLLSAAFMICTSIWICIYVYLRKVQCDMSMEKLEGQK